MTLYKQVFISAFFFLVLSPVQAGQSISVEWSKSEVYYAGQNRNYFYKPTTTSLYYSLDLSESFSLGASLWRSEATENFDTEQSRLQEEGSGSSININYFKGNWSANFGLSVSETDLDIHKLVLPVFYEEQAESKGLNLSVAYLFSFDRVDIVPTFGHGYQEFKIESSGAIPSFTFSRDEQQTSTYAFADLVLSTWFEVSRSSLIQPSIQFGWTEALSGESSLVTTLKAPAVSKGRPFKSNSSESNTRADGSGYIGISLSILIDDYQLRLSHAKTLALDINSDTSSLELGILF
jgi:hypothetical protein